MSVLSGVNAAPSSLYDGAHVSWRRPPATFFAEFESMQSLVLIVVNGEFIFWTKFEICCALSSFLVKHRLTVALRSGGKQLAIFSSIDRYKSLFLACDLKLIRTLHKQILFARQSSAHLTYSYLLGLMKTANLARTRQLAEGLPVIDTANLTSYVSLVISSN